MPSNTSSEQNLANVLERARTAGFFGPGPLRAHLEHARSFGRPIPYGAMTLLDLGSGGGVPGLPLFVRNIRLSGVLLDASEKRCAFLTWAVAELQIADRVEVRRGRAEELGHERDLRARFDVVTCRGFGPPSATIEGAVGFLADGGVLIISEPPSGRVWSEATLDDVGLSQLPVAQYEASIASSGSFSSVDTTDSSPPVEDRTHDRMPASQMDLPGDRSSSRESSSRESSSRESSNDPSQLTNAAHKAVRAVPAVSAEHADSQALVVAFRRSGDVPDNIPRPLRKQRSRPLKVLVSDI